MTSPNKQNRDKTVHVRLTTAEYETYKRQADRARLSVSTYMQMMLEKAYATKNYYSDYAAEYAAEDPELFAEVADQENFWR